MNPVFDCPECGGALNDYGGRKADYRCEDCGTLAKLDGGHIHTHPEPDTHGSKTHTYRLNHAVEGQHHE